SASCNAPPRSSNRRSDIRQAKEGGHPHPGCPPSRFRGPADRSLDSPMPGPKALDISRLTLLRQPLRLATLRLRRGRSVHLARREVAALLVPHDRVLRVGEAPLELADAL